MIINYSIIIFLFILLYNLIYLLQFVQIILPSSIKPFSQLQKGVYNLFVGSEQTVQLSLVP